MKKYLFFVCTLCTFAYSCSNISEPETVQSELDLSKVVYLNDTSALQEVVERSKAANPDAYVFSDPHSEVYKELTNGNLKASSVASVTGFDSKKNMNYSFYAGYTSAINPYDSRVHAPYPNYFITDKYQYYKNLVVPSTGSITIPPAEVMNQYSPMGFIPGTKEKGYSIKLVSTSNGYKTYQFVTEVYEAEYNLLGQKVTSSDNPIFWGTYFYIPKNYTFKYIFVDNTEW